ncbi:MAG: hypothetical protein ACFFDS_03300 [Candidatus Thorarchaeota archaeon]
MKKMNVDQRYYDYPIAENKYDSVPTLDNLPYDYFFNDDYNYLTIPEVQLLLTLSDSRISYSFSGLKKTTSLHQHQLTKALKRLQSRDFLIKNENGTYELTDLGSEYTRQLFQELISKKAVSIHNNQYFSNWKRLKIIPPHEQEFLASYLQKKWFSSFRYLYRKETEQSLELCWEDHNGDQIHMYISSEYIDIEYRSIKPSYSDMQLISKWISDEISSESNFEVDIEEEIQFNGIPYN